MHDHAEYLHANASQILDGLLFGLGVLAVYLGAVFTGALIRSLGGAGSKGLTVAGRYAQGWFYYLRGDDRDIINVTLNMIVDNQLKFDTIVADRRIWFVWPNAYRSAMIRRAARRTTDGQSGDRVSGSGAAAEHLRRTACAAAATTWCTTAGEREGSSRTARRSACGCSARTTTRRSTGR